MTGGTHCHALENRTSHHHDSGHHSGRSAILTDAEREKLLAELRAAQKEAEEGKAVEYDSKPFKARFMRVYRAAKRKP